ncbi:MULTISPECIES: TetR/AcrR family transcriptional regulator [unclassified Streptomyces]|uniref:TetR/AcrR family transcriptional regulator n=1 Tax=unclassified Streptomyces TaxID=2593676 RepID=UPI0004C2537D|nr:MULTISPECIES: TetR/AcrR family transcriptional regulator [unclassified Streptomyces]
MSRWKPNARERLERAALDLFAEQGFAQTTVPQIAERAGLTTRTFFRHFADKREVLFAGEEHIPERVARITDFGATPLTPMAFVEDGLVEIAQTAFADQFARLRAVRAVIATDPGLKERELRKFADLAELVTDALTRNGCPRADAELVAHLATTVLRLSLTRWLDQEVPERSLPDLIRETTARLRSLTRE